MRSKHSPIVDTNRRLNLAARWTVLAICLSGLACGACLDDYSRYDFVQDAGAQPKPNATGTSTTPAVPSSANTTSPTAPSTTTTASAPATNPASTDGG